MSVLSDRPVLLSAGGTGGHLFPAEALARELRLRDVRVELASDERAMAYADRFPADTVHVLNSGTVTGRGLIGKARGALQLLHGIWQARKLLSDVRPCIVVGFGGYPTVPPLLAAANRRIPTLIHEQNAVMGRANRFLASRVSGIATGFDIQKPEGAPQPVRVGIPVRDVVHQAALVPFPQIDSANTLTLCVFGGSQGAKVMSDIVPEAIGLLPEALRHRIKIVQQAREEDLANVRQTYLQMGVDADIRSFFDDLPQRIAASHLVIARGGASTVAELSVIGRASILVPLPGSLDQDQAANARVLEAAGAAKVVRQSEFTPVWLSGELTARLKDMSSLETDGNKAKRIGMPDAASRLADLVIDLAKLNTGK